MSHSHADLPTPPAPTPTRPRKPRGPGLHILLFLATCLSTTLVGGWPYALGLMAILLTHEMGHYIAARVHHVRASLPFFVPMPFSIIGTMGAIIVLRSPFPTRREVFDVGVAGPLAGFAVALPVWLLGLSWSTVETRAVFEAQANLGFGIEFGESLLTWLTSQWMFPNLGDGDILVAHPLALAGWVGFLLTAINLLPAGSLDGGHISYAFFWRHHRRISVCTAVAMLLLGASAIDFFPVRAGGGWQLPVAVDFENPRTVWLFWAGLVTLIGLRHPPPLNPLVPMTRRRRWVGLLTLCIFILTFVPEPLRIIEGPDQRETPHEPELEHHPPREYRPGPGPDRPAGGGHTLDVRATPELHVPLRHHPA